MVNLVIVVILVVVVTVVILGVLLQNFSFCLYYPNPPHWCSDVFSSLVAYRSPTVSAILPSTTLASANQYIKVETLSGIHASLVATFTTS